MAKPRALTPFTLYLQSLTTESSRKAAKYRLQLAARILSEDETATPAAFDWSSVGYEHLVYLRAQLLEREYGRQTINVTLTAVRRVLREAYQLGLVDADLLHRVQNVSGVKGRSPKAGREVPAEEIDRLIDGCLATDTRAGIRDATIIMIMYGCGLRRAEIARLEVQHFDRPAEALSVWGKGHKHRVVYLAPQVKDFIEAWLQIRGEARGPMFLPIDRSDRIGVSKMSPNAIHEIVRRRAKRAGITKLATHDMRRTFITTLWRNGVPGPVIQELAGHASLVTTGQYDRSGEADKRSAVRAMPAIQFTHPTDG